MSTFGLTRITTQVPPVSACRPTDIGGCGWAPTTCSCDGRPLVTLIGFHASHEQLAPSTLRQAVADAEAAGFGAAMCSDHFSPWGKAQGQSGHAWSWLGSTLEATSLSMGVVTAPVQRYHPAVTAQAIATLAEMYPGRFWAALGSGEALNEHITG